MTFFDIYREELQRAITEHPEEYPWAAPGVNNNAIVGNTGITAWPSASVAQVADRMIAAITAKSYNKDGRAMKATCKRLGIKHTYTAINAFIAAERTTP